MLELNYEMKLIQGDCLEEIKNIPDESVNLIITSPPYNIDIDYNSYKDYLEWDKYIKWCKEWLTECYRILKDDGRICINHYINFQDKYEKISRFPLMDIRNIQKEIGFHVHKLIIWEDKTRKKFTAWGSWLSASAPYINTPYEGILISYKEEWKRLNKGISTISKENFMEGVSGIWNLGTTRGKKGTKAVFPISLPKRCIELLTYKDDLILDPFMGSGTTGIVCKNLNRNFIGIELDDKYFEIAKKRIHDT